MEDKLNNILRPLFYHVNGHDQMNEFTKSHEQILELINQSKLDLLKRLEEQALEYSIDYVNGVADEAIPLKSITRERERLEKGE